MVMKIGNIFHQDGMERESHKVGSLSYLPYSHRVLLEIDAFKIGLQCCIPFAERVEQAPFIEEGTDLNFDNIWVGWIYTESNQTGPAYQIILKVDPVPAFVAREFRNMKSIKRPSSHRMVLEARQGK